eukprot:2601789-Alexandrium_andersonii.AAC.1
MRALVRSTAKDTGTTATKAKGAPPPGKVLRGHCRSQSASTWPAARPSATQVHSRSPSAEY